jgi:hypothetical protein
VPVCIVSSPHSMELWPFARAMKTINWSCILQAQEDDQHMLLGPTRRSKLTLFCAAHMSPMLALPLGQQPCTRQDVFVVDSCSLFIAAMLGPRTMPHWALSLTNGQQQPQCAAPPVNPLQP